MVVLDRFILCKGQVDLWTQSSSGCACPGDGGDDCACCVRDGACPCGDDAPTRCAQCGLEQYCANSELKQVEYINFIYTYTHSYVPIILEQL